MQKQVEVKRHSLIIRPNNNITIQYDKEYILRYKIIKTYYFTLEQNVHVL